MNSTARPILLFLIFMNCAFLCHGMEVMQHREELGTLKEQGGDEAEKARIAKEHEEAFKKVEAAFLAGEIKPGLNSRQIRSRYGTPSVASVEGEGQRWLYRSLKGKLLDKPWVFFYFDAKGNLIRWDCGHMPACVELSS